MMEDLSNLSDEELKSRHEEYIKQNAPKREEEDLSKLSDEELRSRHDAFIANPENQSWSGDVGFGPEETPSAPPPKTDQGWQGDIAAGLRGVRAAIPFARDVGSLAKSFATGNTWEEEIARQQAQDEALQKEHPKSYFAGEIGGTFMPLGAPAKVLSAGKLAAGPSIAGLAARGEQAIANKIAPYAGILTAPLSAGVVGAGWGAAQGAGEGKDLESRIKNAESGAKWGAGLGAASPVVAKALGLTGLTASEQAAQDLKNAIKQHSGQNIALSIPASVSTKNVFARPASEFLSGLPFAKGIMERGVERGKSQLAEAVENIPGISTAPGKMSTRVAGKSAGDSIKDWVTNISPQLESGYYRNFDLSFAPHAKKSVNMTKLQSVGSAIDSERAARGAKPSAATAIVEGAFNVPGGLNFERVKALKGDIGRAMSGIKTETSPDETELKALYTALNDDIENHIKNTAGQNAFNQFKKATEESKKINDIRQSFKDVVGKDFKVADEKIAKKLVAYASKGAQENRDALLIAQNAMSQNAWNDLKTSIVKDLGDTSNGFNVTDFVKNYGKLSEEGRDIIFGKKGSITRDSLENVNTIAKDYIENGKAKNLMNRYVAIAGIIGGAGLLTGTAGISTEGAIAALSLPAAAILSKPRLAAMTARLLSLPEGEFRAVIAAEARKQMAPKFGVSTMPVTAEDREQRASGGKIGKRDYPAKPLSRMEKAVLRAQKAIAEETKPIMNMPDQTVAHALEIAKDK
jgi:hypothetical protein